MWFVGGLKFCIYILEWVFEFLVCYMGFVVVDGFCECVFWYFVGDFLCNMVKDVG